MVQHVLVSLASGKDALPAPVVLNLNRVRSGIQEDLSSRHSDPRGRGRQGNLATSSAVQHNRGVLVSVGPIVNDAQVIQLLSGTGDGELDLIAVSIKATNVSRTLIDRKLVATPQSRDTKYLPVYPVTSVATCTPVKVASSA